MLKAWCNERHSETGRSLFCERRAVGLCLLVRREQLITSVIGFRASSYLPNSVFDPRGVRRFHPIKGGHVRPTYPTSPPSLSRPSYESPTLLRVPRILVRSESE